MSASSFGKCRCTVDHITSRLHEELANRLPANDRPRFATFCRQKLSATIALGCARLIRERLPVRIRPDGHEGDAASGALGGGGVRAGLTDRQTQNWLPTAVDDEEYLFF